MLSFEADWKVADYYILFLFLMLEVTLVLKTSMSPDMMMNLVFIFHVTQLSIKNLFETFLY